MSTKMETLLYAEVRQLRDQLDAALSAIDEALAIAQPLSRDDWRGPQPRYISEAEEIVAALVKARGLKGSGE